MYGKTTSGTTFAGTDTTSGGTSYPDTGLHFGVSGITWQASPPTLSVNESLFQSDGIYTTGGSTLWQTPYLSNLKVGSLSAISANLGVVNIATSGNLNSGKTSYSDTTAGFFLGNDSGVPRLAIGNATNSMQWTGTALNIVGSITGTSSINITGTAQFDGAGSSSTIGGLSTAGLFNQSYTANFGLVALSNYSGGSGMYGFQGNVGGQAGSFLNSLGGPGLSGVSLATNNYDIALINGQIQFSSTPVASTNPNTLDAYEEATWTPTLTNFGTTSIVSATYTKIGRTVTFSLIIQTSAAGSSASITKFTLPYAANNLTAFSVYGFNMTSFGTGGFYQALAEAGGTTNVQVSYNPNGSSGNFFAGNFINGSIMVISGTYNATS
jgi:hypothetical protein